MSSVNRNVQSLDLAVHDGFAVPAPRAGRIVNLRGITGSASGTPVAKSADMGSKVNSGMSLSQDKSKEAFKAVKPAAPSAPAAHQEGEKKKAEEAFSFAFPAAAAPSPMPPPAPVIFVKDRGKKVISPLSVETTRKAMTLANIFDKNAAAEVAKTGKFIKLDQRVYIIRRDKDKLHVYDYFGRQKLGPGGGTGVVYKVLNIATGQFEAMKIAHVRESAYLNLKKEALMLRIINAKGEHPNIQQSPFTEVEVKMQYGEPVIALFEPLCHSDVVAWLLEKHTAAERIDCCKQIMIGALELFVKRKVHHLDFKPGNILFEVIGGKPNFRISDFGSAMLQGSKPSLSASTYCFFQNSERAKLRECVEACAIEESTPNLNLYSLTAYKMDIFALGTSLFLILAGARSFPYRLLIEDLALNIKCVDEKAAFDPAKLLEKEYGPEVSALVQRMVDHNPRTRIDLVQAAAAWEKIKI